MTGEQFECVIVGGGPCGALLAGLLARRGLRVLLCDRGESRAWPEETLLPSARRTFAALGLETLLQAVARPDPNRQGAIWGSDALAWRAPEVEPGWRVPRLALDCALRRWANQAGATVWEQQVVLGPLDGERALLRRNSGEHRAVVAPVWVVACGRSFPERLVARRCVAEAAPTAALHLRGKLDPRFADGNLIEAVPEGWFWYLPLTDGTVSLTLLADVGELQAVGARRLLAQALAQARGPATTVSDLTWCHAVRATARVLSATDVFLVGDAAAALDPLASQGIEKALAAAEAAVPAVLTAVHTPRLRPLAIRHHAQWELAVWRAHAALAAEFYRREGRFADAPFWRRRCSAAPAPVEAMPARLVMAPGVTMTTGLVTGGDGLVEAEAVSRNGGDEVVTHFGRVPAPGLLHAFAQPQAPADGVLRAAEQPAVFVQPPQLVHAAIELATTQGWLIPAPHGTP